MNKSHELDIRAKYSQLEDGFSGTEDELDTLYLFKKKLIAATNINMVRACLKTMKKMNIDIHPVVSEFIIYDESSEATITMGVITLNGMYMLNHHSAKLTDDSPYTYVRTGYTYIIMHDQKVINRVIVDTSYKFEYNNVSDTMYCNEFNSISDAEKNHILDSVKAKELLYKMNGRHELGRMWR